MHQILFRFCKSLKSTGELNSSHESKIKKKKMQTQLFFHIQYTLQYILD